MRIYLDNCCFNRPFDDQSKIRVKLEAEAKLFIQQAIWDGKIELIWSYILDYENSYNPFEERRALIQCWKDQAAIVISETPQTIALAGDLENTRIRSKDALHVACAIQAQCDYFVTTDDVLLKCLSGFSAIKVINPVDLTRILEPE